VSGANEEDNDKGVLPITPLVEFCLGHCNTIRNDRSPVFITTKWNYKG
jgi:hypothetical protein